MKIILLSGGKGKRLWPVSTDKMPKQFVPFLNNTESMLKKTYKSILKIYNEEDIFIATSKEYEKDVLKEISKFKNFIFETAYIGTFGAILNILVYLKEVKKVSDEEIISIIPIDHDVNDNFYDNLEKAKIKIEEKSLNICLIGIKPTFPSTQYGYILNNNEIVEEFKEKPKIDVAEKLIRENALWNSGIVVLKIKMLKEIINKYCNYKTYEEFLKLYTTLPQNSFDKEVLEKTQNIGIIKSEESWNDLGTWEILAPKISDTDQYNTNIINLENKKIINDGVKNSIIINSENGIKLINKKNTNISYYEWGYIKSFNELNNASLPVTVNYITIYPKKSLEYEKNDNCKTLYIINGTGKINIEDKIKTLKAKKIITINKNRKHTITADSHSTLDIIETIYENP